MLSLKKKYANKKVQFAVIYISEAHATDEWKLNTKNLKGKCVNQHKSQKERIQLAKILNEEEKLTEQGIHVLVDSWLPIQQLKTFLSPTAFEQAFAAWPERCLIFHKKQIHFISEISAYADMDWEIPVEKWLENYH